MDSKRREIIQRGQDALDHIDSESLAEDMDLVRSGQLGGKFKIEIMFGPDRTVLGPNACAIQLFESGRHFHGGGDALMYMCMDNRKLTPSTAADHVLNLWKGRYAKTGGCGAPIGSDYINGGAAFCMRCQRGINAEKAVHVLILREVSARKIAEVLEALFEQVGRNADIYCKYAQTDMRYVAMARSHGEEIARRLRGLSIYPLGRIIQDLAGGAGAQDQFFKFITA